MNLSTLCALASLRARLGICLIGITLSAAWSDRALAQDDDPFGGTSKPDSGDAFDNPNAATANSSAAGNDSATSYLKTDPLIRRVRANPPKNPGDMAKAITWMVQLRSWENVGSLLDQIAAAKWPVAARAETARNIEPAIWSLLLRSTAKLNEAQGKILKTLQASPAEYARDPAVIESQIDQLASPDRSTQQLALLRVHDGQMPSLNRLVQRLLDGDTKVPAVRLVEAIDKFDRDGIDAIRAACCMSDVEKRSRVLVAVAEFASNHFAIELAVAAHSMKLTPETRDAISKKLLATFSRVPDKNVTADHIARAYQAALDEYQLHRSKISPLMTSLWQPSAEGKIVWSQGTKDLALLQRLAQLAQLRTELDGAMASATTSSVAIQLQLAYQLKPSLADTQVDSLLIAPLPADLVVEPAFWSEVFKEASKQEMHGGAVRALQLLTQQIQAHKLLPPLEFLSQLLNDKRPVVRYLALEAIAAADPKSDYAGSVQALSTAVEMTQLAQGPKALVVGANLELCVSADQIVQQFTSTESVIANSARDAFLALNKQNPVEMIIVVDRVHDLRLHEVLTRLRNSGSLPISVLVENLSQFESSLVTKSPGMHASTLSRDPDHMKIVLEKMMQSLDVRPMQMEDRTRLAGLAGQFITKISADRDTYAFYPVSQWHEQLVSTRRALPPSAEALVLSGLGTKQSQLRLTAMAATEGVTEQDRIAAGRAFEKSVKQFGLQFNDDDIKSTYKLYNQLGPNDPAIAKVMGYLLDVIEAQSGATDWPKPLQ